MSRLALNIAHFKKGSVGSLGMHNLEKRSEKDVHSNQDIDTSRSKDNIALIVPEQGLYQAVKEQVEKSTGRVTKNSVWVSEWVVYPPENLQNPLTADREQLERFGRDVLDWMKAEGVTIPMAVMHLDETTVHMHIDTIPLTADGRLSRKDIYTRAALNDIHTELSKHLADKGWDIQRGNSTEGKQVKAVSVREYKAKKEKELDELIAYNEAAKKQAEISTSLLKTAHQSIQEAKDELKSMTDEKTALSDDLGLLRAKKAEMEHELPALQVQISEAKAELALVQRVIKDTLDNAANHTNWDSVREQIERAKAKAAKEKRAGELETFRSQIVRFFERNPDVKERFLAEIAAEQGKTRVTRQAEQER